LFASLGAAITAESPVEATLEVVTGTSVQTIEAAVAAGVTLHRNGRFETVAATADLALQVDRIQYELRSGPCVGAVLEDSIVRADDLRTDPRWPEFAARAVRQTGVHSMMSFRMYFEASELLAGLNIYATTPAAFDDHAERTGLLLATHGALALTSARQLERIENLERALTSNREIGIAMGILMARHLITTEQAFDLLRITSQRTHRKLADIAHDVIEQGDVELPEPSHYLRPGSTKRGASADSAGAGPTISE
jgi:transcriptional regulator with GAF, ATPase, and Fis domain